AGGTLTLTGAQLSGLAQAIRIGSGAGGATATITGNTITNCGDAVNLLPAINILAAPAALAVNISGNTIADCPDEILRLAAVAGTIAPNVFLNFNTITNPAKGIVNLDTTVPAVVVDCSNNYWGAATGPTVTSTAAKTTPFLRGDTTGGTVYPGVATLANATVGVNMVSSAVGVWTNAGVALYSANPGTTEPPGEVIKYVDVYVNGLTALNNVVITILGIQSSAAQVYAWSPTQGLWVLASNQVIDMFQGAVVVTIGITGIAPTSPTLANLAALEFALVEPPAAAPGTPVLAAPEVGEKDVSLTPTLAWGTIAGAIGYDFELADNSLFIMPIVSLTGDLARLIVPFYAQITDLEYSATYYWRVKTVSATAESAWSAGVFYTVAEVIPEPEPEPVWTCPVCGLDFATRDALAAHAA
ncbi:MAG: hypothetical protein KAW89_04340, partial [Armatimonadetes bacterium]|nr:hypothetical protein [Armatimonadota bacterium]